MNDAWDVASYLSNADLLLSSFRGILARYNEAESVLQSAAASVAVRGVLFGNSHPLPSRFFLCRWSSLIVWILTFELCHQLFWPAGGMLFAGQSCGRLSNQCCTIRWVELTFSICLLFLNFFPVIYVAYLKFSVILFDIKEKTIVKYNLASFKCNIYNHKIILYLSGSHLQL